MVAKKNYFLVLTAIPLYILYCFLNNVFFKENVSVSNVLCLAAFVVCVAFMISCKNKYIVIAVLTLVHITLIVLSKSKLSELTGLITQKLLIYCVFSLPSLSVFALYMLPLNNKLSNKKGRTKAKNSISGIILFFYSLIAVLSIILFALIVSGKEKLFFSFDSTALCLIILFAVIIGFCIQKKVRKKSVNSIEMMPNTLLCVAGAVNCLCYILWSNQYVTDKVYLVLPLLFAFLNIFLSKSTVAGKKQNIR